MTTSPTGPLEEGQRVAGTYRIVHEIGGGAMGVVYEAVDEALPRRVAIKAPRFAAFAQALRREAEALAAIRHHGFVTLHHLAREGDLDLLVMERLYGQSLADQLADLRAGGEHMAIGDVLSRAHAVADALSAAHEAGFAHRDLKPENVVVVRSRVVVLDLGLFVPEVLVGPENVPSGSADYIAPEVLFSEVARGEGPLVDLYALGAMTFELLTSVAPYASETIEATLAKHVSTRVPDPRDLREGVPDELADLVRELLAKDPRERPQSAEEVAWRLEGVRAHLARRGARDSFLQRASATSAMPPPTTRAASPTATGTSHEGRPAPGTPIGTSPPRS